MRKYIFGFGLAFLLLAFAGGASAETPRFGVFRVKSELTNTQFNFFILDTGGIFGSAAYLAEIPENPMQDVNHVAFWSGIWNPAAKLLQVEGLTQRSINSANIYFDNENQIRGTFTTTNSQLSRSASGEILEDIRFTGERLQEEKDLLVRAATDSLVKSADPLPVEGTYVGTGFDGVRLVVSLRSYERGGKQKWALSMRIGQSDTTTILSGYESETGLLRLVHSPAGARVIDPNDVTGLTAIVVRGEKALELHGIYFVPRNGRIGTIHLAKTENVSKH